MPRSDEAAVDTPRCLIVTQDPFLERLIDRVLDHGAYERKHASGADDAESTIEAWRPHLVVLDIDLDDGAGMELVREWKARLRLPILGVTRRDTIESRLGAFERGIDDLLVIPFAPEELVARCIGVMRRVHGREVDFVPEITVGSLKIDLLHQTLIADDRRLELTRIEKALLYILSANAGEVMSRDQLLTYIWGYDADVGANLIDRHIADLRAKLHDDRRSPRFIETIAGSGYRFLAQVDRGDVLSPPHDGA